MTSTRPLFAGLIIVVAMGVNLPACAGDPIPGGTFEPTPDGMVSPSVPGQSDRYDQGTLVIRAGEDEVRVRVEIADTPEERARGLMSREELPPDAGMVFLHEDTSPGVFWMKDTLIPLSLAVWGPEGRILAILDMEPCRTDQCPTYDPGVSWIGAVEVNQGFFQEHGVAVDDPVRLER